MATHKKLHKKGHDDSCQVCVHENRDALEELYLRFAFGGRKRPIAQVFDVAEDHLSAHIEEFGLRTKRVKNTYDLAGTYLDMALENIDPKEIPPSEILKLIKHVDKREGRVVHRVRDERPRLIQVVASPSPGADSPPADSTALPKPKELPTLEAEFDEEGEVIG